MQPKAESSDVPNTDKSNARQTHFSELKQLTTGSIHQNSAMIDFSREWSQTPNLETSQTQSLVHHNRSSREGCMIQTEVCFGDPRHQVDLFTQQFHPSEIDDDDDKIATATAVINRKSGHEYANLEAQQTVGKNDSEFGLLTLEGRNCSKTLPPRLALLQRSDTNVISVRSHKLLAQLEASVEQIPVHLLPSDRDILRYFTANACSLLGFEGFPEIEANYDPVANFFLPFASAHQWCFETMILLYGTYHHRMHVPAEERGTMYPDYLVARQNIILVWTRSRISALANYGDSNDQDIVAFLFLAISEYCAGDREIGRMHVQASRDYCEMRRELGVEACGLLCKIVIWWCVSMLVEDDVVLDSIIDPSTKARIREDPARLFGYFSSSSGLETSGAALATIPERLSRRQTS